MTGFPSCTQGKSKKFTENHDPCSSLGFNPGSQRSRGRTDYDPSSGRRRLVCGAWTNALAKDPQVTQFLFLGHKLALAKVGAV